MTTDTLNAPAVPAAAPVAAPAPAAAAPVAPAAPAIQWLAGADAELVGHVQNKAWQNPVDAVKGHRELEKLLGADRAGRTIAIPQTPDAPEWAGVWEKLGKPKGPDGYGIKAPEGADGAFAKTAAEKFHALNLTQAQGAALAQWYSELGASEAQRTDAEQQAKLQAEHEALAKDWGTGPDAQARKEVARRAMQQLGLDATAVDALEKVTGFSGVLKALAKVGDMMAEKGIEGFNTPGSFGMTPEGAKAKRSQLMADAEWRNKAMDPKSAQWAELQRLDRVISGQ